MICTKTSNYKRCIGCIEHTNCWRETAIENISALIAAHDAPLIEALRSARTVIWWAKFNEASRWNAPYEQAKEFADKHLDVTAIDAALAKEGKR